MKNLIVFPGIFHAFQLAFNTSAVSAPQCDFDYQNTICTSDLDLDCDSDADDVTIFIDGFGRSQFNMPCSPNGPAPVEKTGQTTSWATGDDGDIEKGAPWPNPRFNDRGNGTVVDNLTGLTWLKDANCFGQRTWNEALSDASGLADGNCELTDGSNAGDWRLPNRFELESLLDLQNINPALPSGHPFNNVVSLNYYCSSTTHRNNNSFAWALYMFDGLIGNISKGVDCEVWPVRGGH